MNFTLTYNGILKTNGSIKHKQEIRRVFHHQLLELWKYTPFNILQPPPETLTRQIGNYRFFPLVTESREEIAELKIIMLRPELGPGFIIGQGGDIDNRLKTLFDALRMPKDTSEIPSDDQVGENENPFFCLLEDDKFITQLSVITDRLLEPCGSPSYVKLLIHVEIKKLPLIGANMLGVSR